MKLTPFISSSLLMVSLVESSSTQQKLRRKTLFSDHPNRHLRVPHLVQESRIVGGNKATPGEYPFFVQWDGCGASLIHSDIILSAAHCNEITTDEVLIGAFNSGSTDEGAEFRTITRRSQHPLYDSFTVSHDFLVMKLDSASTKTPVPINTNSAVPANNDELTVIGLGTTSEEAFSGSQFLQEVIVNAVAHDTCNQQYEGEIEEAVMFCAAVPGGGKDSCQGDSGGPIMDSLGTQVGVVSWGNGCGLDQYSGVYSRISGVHEWIAQQICILSDSPPDGCSSSSGGGSAPPTGSVRVKLSVQFDDYPAESGFTLLSASGGTKEVIVNRPAGTFSSQDGLYEEDINLLPGLYELEFQDSAGDGICCGFGKGGYELRTIIEDGNEEGVVLVTSNGQFGVSEITPFTVDELAPGTPTTSPNPTLSPVDDEEAPTTSSPTPSPVDSSPTTSQQPTSVPVGCNDDTDGTVYIDADVGEKNCEWISLNMIRYSYLCQFLDVAVACKATCSACEYFA